MGWTHSTLSSLHGAFLSECKAGQESGPARHPHRSRSAHLPRLNSRSENFPVSYTARLGTLLPLSEPPKEYLQPFLSAFCQDNGMESRVLYWVSPGADGVSTHWRLPAHFPRILQMNLGWDGCRRMPTAELEGRVLFCYGIWVKRNQLEAQPSPEF